MAGNLLQRASSFPASSSGTSEYGCDMNSRLLLVSLVCVSGAVAAPPNAAARLPHRRRAQHQQLPARRAGRRAPAAAFGKRAAHPRRVSRGQQRRRPVVREDHAAGRPGLWSRHPSRSRRATRSGGRCTASSSRSRRDAPELRPRAAVLSSVRVLRDYELQAQGAGRSDGRAAASAGGRHLLGAGSARRRRGISAARSRRAAARACPPSSSSPPRSSRCGCGSGRSPAKRRSRR